MGTSNRTVRQVDWSVNVLGYDVVMVDLLDQVADVQGTPYQVVLTARGWQGRRTPIGRRRTALLTPPGESTVDAVMLLIRRGYLAPPADLWMPSREWKKQRGRYEE